MQPEPVFITRLALETKGEDRQIVRQGGSRLPTQHTQLSHRVLWVKGRVETLLDALALDLSPTDHRFAAGPAMTLEVTGHAADGVYGIIPDIDAAIAVEVHRIGAEAARHELRQTHGARIGALELQRIYLLFTRQLQKFAQLLTEKWCTRRVIEAQGGQGIEHPVIAGVAAIEGFHADDRHDHRGRHAVFALGAAQCLLVFAPEIHTTGDTRLGDEDRPVFLPGLYPLGWLGDGIQNGLLALGFGEQGLELFFGETIAAGQFVTHRLCIRRTLVSRSAGT